MLIKLGIASIVLDESDVHFIFMSEVDVVYGIGY